MQVSVEQLEGLERRLTVQVPADKIDAEIVDRLKSLSPTVKLHGFRPGKVPLKLLKRMYGDKVRQEVLQQILQSSCENALEQEKLRPVSPPRIEPKPIKEGEALEYSATFEVLPEIEVAGIEMLQVERPVAEITEANVAATIEKLRWQRVTWNTVDRPARQDDRLLIDADGSSSGVDLPDGKDQNVAVMLIEGQARPEFLQNLTGLQAGAETEFDVAYPEADPVRKLAGKTVHYKIKVNSVEEPILPAVDEEFIRSLETAAVGMEDFYEVVRDNMERELQERIRKVIKRQIMESLLEANPIPLLPQTLIKAQIANIARQAGFPDADDEKNNQFKAQLFGLEARRRTAFGLILMQLAQANGIEVDEARVRSYLSAISSTYEEPAAMLQHYERTPELMGSIRAMALEEQVVDWLLERAQITDKPISFEEIMQPETVMVIQAPAAAAVQQASSNDHA